MPINTEHLNRCILTLERSLDALEKSAAGSVEYDVFRNATVKGFELTLEVSGKLLRKALKPFFATSKAVDGLVFKDIFRHAAKHGMIGIAEVERWFKYRDNRNNTAHDYGAGFAEETMKLLPGFIADARRLTDKIAQC
jgi:nucleotidyltransferase substrate binding protein (TIGR01987 family)